MKYKKYNHYKNKLLKFAKESGVRVFFKSDDDGEYNYYIHKNKKESSVIYIKKNQSSEKKIAILLHELGHFLDYTRDERRWKINKSAYDSIEFLTQEPLKPKHKFIIYQTEIRAWKEAKGLAVSLGIPTDTWFRKYKKITLSSYKKLQVEE